jgi:peptidoglycan/xylan/chitin deacetylase (PgdA/CDA1 family)
MTYIPNACYLSLDVEDYPHATMLDMGLRPRTNPEQTWRGLRRILSVLRQAGGHPNMTLFTTGQIARDQPALIREMSRREVSLAINMKYLTLAGRVHRNVRARMR